MPQFTITPRIDEVIHKALKKASYEQEMSINSIAVEALTDWLKKYGYLKK